MAKKSKNGLVENQKVVESSKPKQEVKLVEVAVQSETPGHKTRAFRG